MVKEEGARHVGCAFQGRGESRGVEKQSESDRLQNFGPPHVGKPNFASHGTRNVRQRSEREKKRPHPPACTATHITALRLCQRHAMHCSAVSRVVSVVAVTSRRLLVTGYSDNTAARLGKAPTCDNSQRAHVSASQRSVAAAASTPDQTAPSRPRRPNVLQRPRFNRLRALAARPRPGALLNHGASTHAR
jgi:hypothetical protein